MSGFIDANGLMVQNITTGVIPFQNHFATHWDSSNGFVAGGGIQWDDGPTHIATGVRYTKWGDGGPNNLGANSGFRFESNRDQIDVILGLSWTVHQAPRK
jgi:hypothetical protein